jgi:hypothetical protein
VFNGEKEWVHIVPFNEIIVACLKSEELETEVVA